MSASYLLECEGCGAKVPVGVQQAGGTVSCTCGRQLSVPKLRDLRQLAPVEVEETAVATRKSTWSPRHGLGLVGVLLVLLGTIPAILWTRQFINRPNMEKELAINSRFVASWSPADSFEYWTRSVLKFGVHEPQSPLELAYERNTLQLRILVTLAYAVAGLGVVLMIAAIAWPNRKKVVGRPLPASRGGG